MIEILSNRSCDYHTRILYTERTILLRDLCWENFAGYRFENNFIWPSK